jgi:metal-responsive CopG/Arc/MetJ family transcriptional regulator
MKQRVTVTLESDYVSYLDQIASEMVQSRSMVVQTIIANYRRRQRQMELARQAAQFFAQPEQAEEAAERADWEALGLEVLNRDE